MKEIKNMNAEQSERIIGPDPSWKGLYKAGGISAIC